MIFAEVLNEVVGRLDDCVGLVVMGMDGIPIERVIVDQEVNFDMLATECTTLLKDSRQAALDVEVGSLRELIFMTDMLVVLVVTITDDYVLLGAVRQGGNYGRARFLLKRATLRLEKEFS
jgi:predicted regulator of Ras-like GTPase activity (Roadblock/LC7/MglB family)